MILAQPLDSVAINIAPSKTWFLDFESGHIRAKTDGTKAVAQSAMLDLQTARYHYPIFSFQYGSELQTLIGKESDFVYSEAKRMIQDALSTDDRILSLQNFSWKDGRISFFLTSIFGDEQMEVEVYNEQTKIL